MADPSSRFVFLQADAPSEFALPLHPSLKLSLHPSPGIPSTRPSSSSSSSSSVSRGAALATGLEALPKAVGFASLTGAAFRAKPPQGPRKRLASYFNPSGERSRAHALNARSPAQARTARVRRPIFKKW